MRTISDYIKQAMENHGISSRRQLAKHLGLTTPNTVHFWEKRNTLPTDEHMLDLAQAAGIPELEALCDLSIWRAKAKDETRAAERWEQLRKAITPTAAAIALTIALNSEPSFTIKHANAFETNVVQMAHNSPDDLNNINYANL